MNKIIRIKYYFVILLSTFIAYIYLQNMRVKNEFDSHFSCIIEPGRVDVCTSDKIISLEARILTKVYQTGSHKVYKMGDLSIYFKADDQMYVGDKIRVFGKLEKRLLKSGNVQKRLISSDIHLISRGKDQTVFSAYKWLFWLSELSNYMSGVIDKYLIPTHSKLVAGILFGIRDNIPIILYNNLIKTGTIHVVAASGYNVSIIAGFFIAFLSKILKRKQAVLLAVLSVVVFVFISGGGEAVVRAGVMGTIAFIAQFFGRMYYGLYSLGLTALIMLVFKPTLITSVSFQLSVASTFGIMVLGNRLINFFDKMFKGESFAKGKQINTLLLFLFYDLSITFAATVFTLPIILVYFDRFSTVSLIVNSLVLWTIPPIMIFGFLLVFFGSFSYVLGQTISIFLWPFLMYFTRVVNWFGSLGFASYEMSWFNWYMLIGYYVVLMSILAIKFK